MCVRWDRRLLFWCNVLHVVCCFVGISILVYHCRSSRGALCVSTSHPALCRMMMPAAALKIFHPDLTMFKQEVFIFPPLFRQTAALLPCSAISCTLCQLLFIIVTTQCLYRYNLWSCISSKRKRRFMNLMLLIQPTIHCTKSQQISLHTGNGHDD